MICFTWWGLTQYAARCIGAFVRASNESVVVIATRPSAPIKGMEEALGCPVIWCDESDDASTYFQELPRVLFISNWSLPVWHMLEVKVRDAGGKVIAMCDENYVFSLRKVIKALRFRIFLKSRFDGFFVPGASGRKLFRFYGAPDSLIQEGLYAADQSIFFPGIPLSQRQKCIIFVGQFIDRKNVLRLVSAFRLFHQAYPDWTLEMYGHGVLHASIPQLPGLIVRDFVQPLELAKCYRHARAFILPSLEEHWGLVVHEAALSGCMLLLSRGIGAGADFSAEHNVKWFIPTQVEDIVRALENMAMMNAEELDKAYLESCEQAKKMGMSRFVDGVTSFLSEKSCL